MAVRRSLLVVTVALGWLLAGIVPLARQAPLPERFTDAQFWALTERLSEPDGEFLSDNLVSNELVFEAIVPALRKVAPGGVYLGVGPEQNFTYIAATRPALAVIVDIRRGNLHLHLLYKALFERSPNRRAFVAALFGRWPLADVDDGASAAELMAALRLAPAMADPAFDQALADTVVYLERSRGFALREGDAEGLAYVWRAFRAAGPDIVWSRSTTPAPPARAVATVPSRSFERLMTQADEDGNELGFLADEAAYHVVRDLQLRNLVLPVVGDFGGPKALRSVGDLLRSYDRSVTTFYVSNVETYLRRASTWDRFCHNVRTMPLADEGWLVRPSARSVTARVTITGVRPLAGGTTTGQWRQVTVASPALAARLAGLVRIDEAFAACESGGPAPGVH